MVYKSGQIVLPFCHNARVWRTDGQTDRIFIARPRLHCMQRGKNEGYTRGPVLMNWDRQHLYAVMLSICILYRSILYSVYDRQMYWCNPCQFTSLLRSCNTMLNVVSLQACGCGCGCGTLLPRTSPLGHSHWLPLKPANHRRRYCSWSIPTCDVGYTSRLLTVMRTITSSPWSRTALLFEIVFCLTDFNFNFIYLLNLLSIPYFQVFHEVSLPYLCVFFLRCSGAQVYSVLPESKKEVDNNAVLTVAILYRFVHSLLVHCYNKSHHFHSSPFWCESQIPKFTKFDPPAGGTELTSPFPGTLPHSWPFEPRTRTQYTHILVPGAATDANPISNS